jgi:hypothetical protein
MHRQILRNVGVYGAKAIHAQPISQHKYTSSYRLVGPASLVEVLLQVPEYPTTAVSPALSFQYVDVSPSQAEWLTQDSGIFQLAE